LYSFFADLDRLFGADQTTYSTLKELPIWLSSKGLVRADQALLRGDFTDPTGEADLLDADSLTEIARDFIARKLGVKNQTIGAFVQEVLPKFFGVDGPKDPSKYQRLLIDLADHASLIDDEGVRLVLCNLHLIPTLDGG